MSVRGVECVECKHFQHPVSRVSMYRSQHEFDLPSGLLMRTCPWLTAIPLKINHLAADQSQQRLKGHKQAL